MASLAHLDLLPAGPDWPILVYGCALTDLTRTSSDRPGCNGAGWVERRVVVDHRTVVGEGLIVGPISRWDRRTVAPGGQRRRGLHTQSLMESAAIERFHVGSRRLTARKEVRADAGPRTAPPERLLRDMA